MADTEWHESWLGRERFAKFLSAARGDRSRAIALVEWDREMGGELMKGLGEWELALRNSYDAVLTAWWKGKDHWLLDPESPVRIPMMRHGVDLNEKTRSTINKAMRRVKGEVVPATIIANLTLDFWRYLSVTSREKTLWVPVLHRAFPYGTRRVAADQQIDGLYRLRNRLAHREPVFHLPIQPLTTDLFGSCERLRPELFDAMLERNPYDELWRQNPLR